MKYRKNTNVSTWWWGLHQPFYYSQSHQKWTKLTYGTKKLDYAVKVGRAPVVDLVKDVLFWGLSQCLSLRDPTRKFLELNRWLTTLPGVNLQQFKSFLATFRRMWSRWCNVTFWSPSWRSRFQPFERSLNYPKKVRKDCQDPYPIFATSFESYGSVFLRWFLLTKRDFSGVRYFCNDFFDLMTFNKSTSVKLSWLFLGGCDDHGFWHMAFVQRFGAIQKQIAGEWPLGELWCGYSAGVRVVEMGRQKETIYIICIYIYLDAHNIYIYKWIFFFENPFWVSFYKKRFLVLEQLWHFRDSVFSRFLWPLMVPWERCNVQHLSSMYVNIIYVWPDFMARSSLFFSPVK